MNIRKNISKWYQGKPIENPNMRLVGFYDQPWIAEKADRAIIFVKKEWRWLTGTLITFVTLVIQRLN